MAIERLVFDTARERRAEQEKLAKEMAEEKDKANQHEASRVSRARQSREGNIAARGRLCVYYIVRHRAIQP